MLRTALFVSERLPRSDHRPLCASVEPNQISRDLQTAV
jgi:hypothetical protein